jgi:hypothetical protein
VVHLVAADQVVHLELVVHLVVVDQVVHLELVVHLDCLL